MMIPFHIMKKTNFDIIVIGGGATGAGIALDASLRGLSVALFEQNDFAEGTSSRSTKLVHGGVRYLEAAVKRLDKAQYALVREGLKERKLFLQNASHLAHPIQLITPLYKWYEIPYIYAGLFLYDLISGKASLGRSRLMGAKKALSINPSINPKGLKAAVSYYDGAFNDARMVIALLQSATANTATVHNHHKVVSLLKDNKQISGVTVLDKSTGEQYSYKASVVINATGPFVDDIRLLDEPSTKPIIQASSGIHIVVDSKFLPSKEGLMIPETSDGRVLFALPYQGRCLIGTTDNPAKLSQHPKVTQEEIEYLLANVNSYFGIKISQADILSSFSGLRPLLIQDESADTAHIVREHIEEFSDSGLLTIAGGKWTSYRSMAESAIDLALVKLGKSSKTDPCQTTDYKVIGSQQSQTSMSHIPKHLFDLYGDQSQKIIDIAHDENATTKLHPKLETSTAELIYTIRHEYVKKPLDFITRRSNIGLLDKEMAIAILPKVCKVMRDELGWSDEKAQEMEAEALAEILD